MRNNVSALQAPTATVQRRLTALAFVAVLAGLMPGAAYAGGLLPPSFVTTPGAQTIVEDGTTGDLIVVLADIDLQNLVLTATSGNTTLIPNANLTITPASGGPLTYARTIRVTPAANRNTARDNAGQPVLITLQVTDASGNSVTDFFSVNVREVNDAPQANADTLSAVTEDAGPWQIPVAALTGNDNAGPLESYQTLSVTTVSGAIGGSVALAGGIITFTPQANFNGTAGFDYTIVDNGVDNGVAAPLSASATAQFGVLPMNDAPAANADAYATSEDQMLSVSCNPTRPDAPRGTSACVLANDSDIDGDTLVAELVTAPAHGTLALSADGSFTYTPHADFHGTDSFVYRAGDGSAFSAPTLATIDIASVDDQPVANDDGPFATLEDVGVADIGVLANDAFGQSPLQGDGPASIAIVGGGATAAGGSASIDDAGTPGDIRDDRIDYTPPADHFGADSFSYAICDGDGQCATATVSITLAAVNDAPTFVLGSDPTAAEDSGAQAIAGFLANVSAGPANESDQTLAIAVSSDNAALFAAAPAIDFDTGALSWTATPDAHGSATVTVTLTDDGGSASGGSDSSSRQFQIHVTAVNDVPTANDDTLAIAEDGTLAPTAPGVLGNDVDVDGDALTASLVTGPAHGDLSLAADGSFSYAPHAEYHGSDSFTYRAADGDSSSAPATVHITVTPENDAPLAQSDAYASAEDQPLAVDAAGVLGNDSDVDGDALSAALVDDVVHGTLALAADGGFTYTPDADFHGTDTFTYRAGDGAAASAPVTVTITVSPANDAPVATADAYAAYEDVPLSVGPAAGVLGNDGDVDGDTLAATLVEDVAHGTLALAADGSFTYTPAANFNGSDGFTYRAADADAQSPPVAVTLIVAAVNDAPTFTLAGDQLVPEDAGAIVAPAFLGGASAGPADESAQQLTLQIANDNAALFAIAPAIDAETGTLTYTPADDAHGEALVTVTLRDDGGSADGGDDASTAQFRITVTSVNDAPVAKADAYGTDEDQALTIAAAGVLANDGDADGDTLTATLVDGAQHGSVQLAADGGFVYTPAGDYVGADSFTYQASDGTVTTVPVTVTLNVAAVNDLPVAQDDSHGIPEDDTLQVAAPGVLGNDSDTESDTLAATVVAGPAHGTLVLAADGGFDYTPHADFHGDDSFTYRAGDGGGASEPAAVHLTVSPVNDAPVSAADARDAVEDQPLVVTAPGVLANDGDVDGDALTVTVTAGPAHGTLTLQPDGGYTYTPAVDFNGVDSFTYRAHDADLASGDTTVTLTVAAVNDAPGFAPLADQTVAEDAGTITVPGFLADVAAGPPDEAGQQLDVTVSSDNAALFGEAPAIALGSGTLSFAAAANASGAAVVTVTLHDDGGTADGGVDHFSRTFTITVGSDNDAPVAGDDAYAVDEDQTLDVTVGGLLDNDTDVDGDTPVAQLLTQPAHGTVTLDPAGTFRYVPAADWNGSDAFTYAASDGEAQSAPATVKITVTPVNDAPSFAPLSDQTLVEDAGAMVVPGFLTAASAGPADESGQVLSVAVSTDNDALFAVVPSVALGTGELQFTGAENANGSAQVTVTLTDNGGGNASFSRTFRITLSAVNDPPVFESVPQDIAAVAEDSTTGPLPITLADVDGDTITLLRSSGNQALFPNANVALGGSGNARSLTFTTATDQNSAIAEPDFTEINLTAIDSNGGIATATFRIGTVTPVADAPQFQVPAPAQVAAEDVGPRVVDNFAVQRVVAAATASDEIAQQHLVAFEVTQTGGTMAFATAPAIDVSSGRLTYETAADASGTAVFQAVLVDSGNGTAPGVNRSVPLTFTITATPVNDLPTAAPDAHGTDEDTTLQVATPGVLGNDADADGDVLQAQLDSGPAHGTLQLAADGGFTYTPAVDYHGSDAFTYRVIDGQGGSDPVTVTLSIDAVNDAPAATADTYITGEDEPLQVNAPGVLANDSDAELEPLVATLVNGPRRGQVALAADGSFLYTPAADFTGVDEFSYAASDGAAQSEPVVVAITVSEGNDLPTATPQSATTPEDTALSLTLAGTDPDGGSLTFTIVDAPAHGTLTGNGANRAYAPDTDFSGDDSFTFVVSDGSGTSAPATVDIAVLAVNDAPAFVAAATQAYAPGASGPRSVPGWVTAVSFGPADESGQSVLSYEVTPVSDATGVLASAVTVSIDGTLQFALSGATGVATVDVRLRDDGGTAAGGHDLSMPLRLTIAAGLTTDLAISKDNGVTHVSENQVVTYTIVARNTGASVVNGARVTDPMPGDLADVSWTCVAENGATCPAAGMGDIDASVNLPPGAQVTFTVQARVSGAMDEIVSNTAYVAPPPTMVDGNGADNEATDSDVADLFHDGME